MKKRKCLRTVSALNFLSVSFSFSGRLLTQAKKQGGSAFGGRFNQPLTYSSFFSAGELLNLLSNASKCFQAYIENLHEDEKERLRELYREFHEKKENIHRVFEKIDYETGEIK
jgi:hypothetical protein